jgi:hypothetical protein
MSVVHSNPSLLTDDSQDTELLLPELQFLPNTKVREKDPVLRAIHLETLILLCSTRWGRDIERTGGVYEIIRMMHETETDDNVSGNVSFCSGSAIYPGHRSLPLSNVL